MGAGLALIRDASLCRCRLGYIGKAGRGPLRTDFGVPPMRFLYVMYVSYVMAGVAAYVRIPAYSRYPGRSMMHTGTCTGTARTTTLTADIRVIAGLNCTKHGVQSGHRVVGEVCTYLGYRGRYHVGYGDMVSLALSQGADRQVTWMAKSRRPSTQGSTQGSAPCSAPRSARDHGTRRPGIPSISIHVYVVCMYLRVPPR